MGGSWVSKGKMCPACEGAATVAKRQFRCRQCKGAGVLTSVLGLRSAMCPACDGQRYLQHRQHPCRVCSATGRAPGFRIFGWRLRCFNK